MLLITKDGGTARMRAIALTALGRFESQRGNINEGIEAVREALGIAAACGAADVEIDARYILAHGLARLGKYEEAELQVAALREDRGDERLVLRRTRALQIEMAIAGTKQDTPSSHRAANEILEIARTTGDRELEVAALMQLAWSSQPSMDSSVVRKRYAEAMECAEKIGYEVGAETSAHDLGVFESRIGNHRGSLACFERALAYARRGTSAPNLGYTQANRARELLELGQKAEALVAAQESQQIAVTTGERRLTAAASMAMGLALFSTGDCERGLEKMLAALDIRREIGDKMGFGGDLCEYAEAAVAAKRSDDYPWIIKELKALCAAGPETFQQPVRICYVLGVVLEAAGEAPAARGYYMQGQALLTAQFARISDEETRSYVGGQRFNQALLARLARL